MRNSQAVRPSDAPMRRKRSGIAIPAALAAITAVSVLMSGIWVIVDLNAKTSTNRRSALSALLIAEAGVSHSLALLRGELKNTHLTKLLRGSDDQLNNADDGLLIGYSLSTDKEIPPTGVTFGNATYYVTLEDDPADTDGNPKEDSNNRILMRCRGTLPDGASATIEAVVGMIPLPAIATEGILKIGGNPRILGPCGGIHANEIIQVSGNPTVQGQVTASDTVMATDCRITKPDGTCNVPLHNQPPVDIPTLTMEQVCSAPSVTLNANGTLIDHVPEPDKVWPNDGVARFGWKWGGNKWTSVNPVRDGMICAKADIEISSNWGIHGAPARLSIYTTHSVSISGNPTLMPFDPNGGLIIAEGDVEISGNPSAGDHNNYTGMIYAGAQCKINGNPRLFGQLLCKDLPQPVGAKDYVDISDLNADVSGNPEIIFDCTGSMLSKRKILSWGQKIGS
jgi:hypothetical protein